MKHVVKAISLTCDGCGQQFETLDGMTCYADDEDGKLVEDTACNSDWKIMNGHHYCPSCWERDDDDIIHTKDGRKWDDSSIEVVEVKEGDNQELENWRFMKARTVDTIRGRYAIKESNGTAIAVSMIDDQDIFEFDVPADELTDDEVKDRIKGVSETGEVGVWRTDFDNIPRGVPLLLYSGEIYEPAVGCISETDDEVISDCYEYDHCPLKHIDQFMIIPDFEP